jgi:hypothetical protein
MWRTRLLPLLLVLGSATTLLLVCFRSVLFQGEQFAFRDVGNFYYPLHFRVQQEWRSGRWPLWDAWQNGGQPLVGNPMAAVLYPGKLIFVLRSYAWGSRLYVVGHTAWAFLGMCVFARSLGVSWAGSALSGLSYAFGAPVLFQYCNVIFLVGAAWVPWGLCAVDRVVRLRQALGVPALAVVLAMEVLGGDPQAAYLTVVSGAGYAVVLALGQPSAAARAFRLWPRGLALVAGWIVATLIYAQRRPAIPGWVGAIWMPACLAWAIGGGAFAWCWWRGRWVADRVGPPLAALAGASLLAAALAAAQLVPVAEFTARSSRMGEVQTLTLSRFSLEPYRLVECLWPGIFGHTFPENRTWIHLLPPANDRQLWLHSLYMGGLVPLFVLAAAGFRGKPPWRAWLTAVAALSLLASFGRFASPLWWLRWSPRLVSLVGPHDPLFSLPRPDSYSEDGACSPYALLTAVLPGLGLFRYASKLFTFTAAAAAVLTGAGWDEVMAGRAKGLTRACVLGVVASAVALGLAVGFRAPVIALLARRTLFDALSGPLDAAGAWGETQRALAHGLAVCASGLALARWGPRRPRAAGALVLAVCTIDLALTSPRLIWTVPQAVFDRKPEAVQQIEAAERREPSGSEGSRPLRVHRLPFWHPDRFLVNRSPDRVRELAQWEHDSLQGLNGLPWGIASSVTLGVLELDEYLLLFQPQTLRAEPDVAKVLSITAGQPFVYYPRRSYDLWGTHYFLLPVHSEGWATEARGYAALVPRTESVYPDPHQLNQNERARWAEQEDWHLTRNRAAFPSAWIVHQARVVGPATDPEARARLFAALAYQNDPFWHEPARRVFDPRVVGWIETANPGELMGYVGPDPTLPDESVTITRHEAGRVDLLVRLRQPGLVILAETYYPGWRLTIDGEPARILRANRMMRGAAVRAGEHRLVYVYDPWSFRIGGIVSLLGLTMLLGCAGRLWFSSPFAGGGVISRKGGSNACRPFDCDSSRGRTAGSSVAS